FVGEWMVILGTVRVNFWIAALAASTMIWGAAYTLWMVKRVYFGKVANDDVRVLKDLDGREFAMLGVLAAGVLALGVYPKPFTDVMHASVAQLLRQTTVSKTTP
ncbi:MAG: NADH-quinone oxidoreductase subunit M, partial [Caldimonas sp.]